MVKRNKDFFKILAEQALSKEFCDLKKQLFKKIIKVIKTNFGKKHAKVVLLKLQGKTQVEIAEELGIHRTTVHRILMGRKKYSDSREKCGGAIENLKEICSKDEVIIEILQEIGDVNSMLEK
jgi:DNA-directed RNA polymerase specialized sigma24 family protein